VRKPRAKNVTGRRTTSFFHIFFFGRFFWAGRGRRNSRARTAESFSQDDASFRTALFMLYIIVSSGGFTAACVRPSRTVPPILDDLDIHVCRSSFDKSTTSSTLKTVRVCCTSFRHGLHGAVGMVSYAHVVYVTCYFCYMFRFRVLRVVIYMLFNAHLFMYIILLETGGGTQGTVLYTVRGVRGLGIRMLTFDTKTSLYAEDQGLQVPMTLGTDIFVGTSSSWKEMCVFICNCIKKGEDRGYKTVTLETIMNTKVDKVVKKITHHVPPRQLIYTKKQIGLNPEKR
jgi:hypothetical protein